MKPLLLEVIKMVKCPYCSEEIEKLHCVMTGRHEYFCFFFDGDIEYKNKGFNNGSVLYEYTCPVCHHEVCRTQGDAIAFLLGDSKKVNSDNSDCLVQKEGVISPSLSGSD